MTDIARLRSVEELDPLFERSNKRPIWVFKHSLICPVSTAALSEFRRFVDELEGEPAADCRLIEIQRARPVSDAVAERTGVRHQSPQALLVDGGRVVWHRSHWEIRAAELAAAHREHGGGETAVG